MAHTCRQSATQNLGRTVAPYGTSEIRDGTSQARIICYPMVFGTDPLRPS
jgi:hypothetical protein